jgi:TetR/AcrR family transcriptional regulator, repressor for neighboring sulfatase
VGYVTERAGVNHALVHRHFGTKDEIVRQALVLRSQAVADRIRARAQGGQVTVVHARDVLAEEPAYWITHARVILDDPALAGTGTAPTTELFANALGQEGAELSAAGVTACLMLGWRVFADFVAGATGVRREELDQQVSAVIPTLLRG